MSASTAAVEATTLQIIEDDLRVEEGRRVEIVYAEDEELVVDSDDFDDDDEGCGTRVPPPRRKFANLRRKTRHAYDVVKAALQHRGDKHGSTNINIITIDGNKTATTPDTATATTTTELPDAAASTVASRRNWCDDVQMFTLGFIMATVLVFWIMATVMLSQHSEAESCVVYESSSTGGSVLFSSSGW